MFTVSCLAPPPGKNLESLLVYRLHYVFCPSISNPTPGPGVSVFQLEGNQNEPQLFYKEPCVYPCFESKPDCISYIKKY